jgi:4-alpha-glucanotransferase
VIDVRSAAMSAVPGADAMRANLERLGVRRMLLAIHDASFPADPDEDHGRGSPATRAATRLFAYARGLGFTGIQLGPQGQTSRANPSPYDGTIFSRHLGNIALGSLRAGGRFAGLVSERAIDRTLVTGGGPAQHQHAYDATQALLDEAYGALEAGARPDLRDRLATFRDQHAEWLVPDALHAALCANHGGGGGAGGGAAGE